MSRLLEPLAVVVPPALVPGWADTRAMCDEAAVELPPALVPGWADKTATADWAHVISIEEAWNWSILEDIISRAVVRFPSVSLTLSDFHPYS